MTDSRVGGDDLSAVTTALWMAEHEAQTAARENPRSQTCARRAAQATRAFRRRLLRLEKLARLAWRTRGAA